MRWQICGLLLAAAYCVALCAGCGERSSPAATALVDAPQAHSSQANVDSAAVDAAAAPAKSATATNQPARDIGFDNIKFDMQKDAPFQRKMITPAIEQLHNTKIRIRGYILPSFQQSGLSQFVLVRDNMQCCFGPGAALYDCIVVQMDGGHTADFTTRPVAVEGTFSIQEIASPEGKCLAIYHMQADNVQ
jgi:hypothetical protein